MFHDNDEDDKIFYKCLQMKMRLPNLGQCLPALFGMIPGKLKPTRYVKVALVMTCTKYTQIDCGYSHLEKKKHR